MTLINGHGIPGIYNYSEHCAVGDLGIQDCALLFLVQHLPSTTFMGIIHVFGHNVV